MGAVFARLRRVSAGRGAQRLLVLGGLLIAGWLLGCAAQSAHADEGPAAPARVVAETPVLGDAVTTVHERAPVRRVVRAVEREAPRAVPVPVKRVTLPEVSADPVAVREGPAAAVADEGSRSVRRAHEHVVRRVSTVSNDRTAVAPGARHAVQHHRAPQPAPDHPDGGSTVGGLALGGATAGLPDVGTWAPAPPRAALPRVSGAMPPAVRTAADEPSFAPD
jgi:hypothetical protein